MNKALLLIAHGSKRKESNQEILELVEKLQDKSDQFEVVRGCFLEMAQPDIMSAISSLVEQGAKEISILPYFLAAGNHITNDIPRNVEKYKQQYSDVKFNILKHFGSCSHIADTIIEHVS
jgi:sirohydrochlorin cobaltochelatase